MKLRILNPKKCHFDGEASLVNVPGKDGSFGILDNHAPVLAALKAGTVAIVTTQGRQEISINGGIVEVSQNQVTILDF